MRLSDEDRVALQGEGGSPFEPMPGRAMKAYVELPPEVLADLPARDAWLQRALEHAAALPPKGKS